MTMKLQDETTLDLQKFEMQHLLGIAFCEASDLLSTAVDLTEASWVLFGQTDQNQPVKVSFMRLEDKGAAQVRLATISIDIAAVREVLSKLERSRTLAQERDFVETLQEHVDNAHRAARVSVAAIQSMDGMSQRTCKLRTDVLLTLEGLSDQIRDLSCYVEKCDFE